MIDEGGDLLGVHTLAHRGESGDIREHDCELPFFGLGAGGLTLRDQPCHQFARHISFEGPETAKHLVEGGCQIVDFSNQAGLDLFDLVEIERPDLCHPARNAPNR